MMPVANIAIFLVTVYVINSSLATNDDKRNRNDPESSSAIPDMIRNNVHGTITINYRELAIDVVNKILISELECTPESLNKFKFNRPDEIALKTYLLDCELIVKKWFKFIMWKLDKISIGIERWMTSISNILQTIDSVFYPLINSDWREDKNLSKKLRRGWKDKTGLLESALKQKRAFYFGDGICIHMLAPPFDKIEKFMQTIMRDFDILNNPESRINITSRSLEIYIFQKFCRRFDKEQKNPQVGILQVWPYNTRSIHSLESACLFLETHISGLESKERSTTNKCSWNFIFEHKKQYRFLYEFLRNHEQFEMYKRKVDQSMDLFVENCLLSIENSGGNVVDEIYERVRRPKEKQIIKDVAARIKKTIGKCEFSLKQTINSLLDSRSPSSCRKHIIQSIMQVVIFNPNLELVKIFTDLLRGHLGSIDKGIFKEPIYENETSSEYKVIDFLFHVFSIKGYQPRQGMENPLLDFYYLYKIAEMSAMIPILEFGEPVREVVNNLIGASSNYF